MEQLHITIVRTVTIRRHRPSHPCRRDDLEAVVAEIQNEEQLSKQDHARGVDLRDTGRTITAAERFDNYKSIFQAVTARWKRARQSQPIVACQIDPAPVTRSNQITPDALHFCIDVERATERILGNRLDLQAAWFSLVAGEPVPAKITREVVTLCGRAYAARKLQPWAYFAPLQRGPRP